MKRPNYPYFHPPPVTLHATLHSRATTGPPRPPPTTVGPLSDDRRPSRDHHWTTTDHHQNISEHHRTIADPCQTTARRTAADPRRTTAGCWTAKGIFGNEQNFPGNLILLPNVLKYTCLGKLFSGIIFLRLRFSGMKIETLYQTPHIVFA